MPHTLTRLVFCLAFTLSFSSYGQDTGETGAANSHNFYLVPGQMEHQVLLGAPESYLYQIGVSPHLVNDGRANNFVTVQLDKKLVQVGSTPLVVQASDAHYGYAIVAASEISVLKGNADNRYVAASYAKLSRTVNQQYTGQWMLTEKADGLTHYVLIAKLDKPSLVRLDVKAIDAPTCCKSQASHGMTVIVDGIPNQLPMYGDSSVDVYGSEVGIYMSSFDAGQWFKVVGEFTVFYGGGRRFPSGLESERDTPAQVAR